MAEQQNEHSRTGRWAGYFFKPCPRGLFAILGGAAWAALLVGAVLLCGHLLFSGFNLAAEAVREASQPNAKKDEASAFAYDIIAPWRQHLVEGEEAPSTQPQGRRWHGGVDTFARGPLTDDALPFAEIPNAPLYETIKQIDYILIQTMQRLALGVEACMLVSHERRTSLAVGSEYSGRAEKPHLFQRLRFYLPPDAEHTPERFARILDEMLGIWSDRARLHRESSTKLRIDIDGVATHELFLSQTAREARPRPEAGRPVLTIVIDDMGASPEAAQRLLSLGIPLTFSVWPRAAYAEKVAQAAWSAGQEVIIHQPCEPVDYPSQKPGPGAIFAAMSREEITRIFSANIARVPHAVGVNNHMGSRFTMNAAASDVFCDIAAEHGLFVLDSVTTPRSILASRADAKGITSYRRAVFLDDPLSKKAVHAALRNAERIAKKEGQAIAIGHPHNETIEALREWSGTRDTSIELVPLRLQRPGPDARPGARANN